MAGARDVLAPRDAGRGLLCLDRARREKGGWRRDGLGGGAGADGGKGSTSRRRRSRSWGRWRASGIAGIRVRVAGLTQIVYTW